MRTKVGYVTSIADMTRTGSFKVTFDLNDPKTNNAKPETVRYVSPYGSDAAGWVAIPQPGSYVLVGYAGKEDLSNGQLGGYFYLGSLYGGLLGTKSWEKDTEGTEGIEQPPVDTANSGPGMHGDSGGKVAKIEGKGIFPKEFNVELYEAKGIIPEKIGFTSTHGDAFTINNRFRTGSSADGPPLDEFTDHRIEMRSGSGKKIKCVDTPEVDAIIIHNEHIEKDRFVWQTTNNGKFAEGEANFLTHGPIKWMTSESFMRHRVEEGQNLEIINTSTGARRPGKGGTQPQTATGGPDEGDGGRYGQIGPEDYGCVIIESTHNNIVIRGLEDDSCIRVLTPGSNGKVLVDSGGTVDLRAATKISLTAPLIELSADVVDINGATNVDIDGGTIDLN